VIVAKSDFDVGVAVDVSGHPDELLERETLELSFAEVRHARLVGV
jgi:hypothetical protein